VIPGKMTVNRSPNSNQYSEMFTPKQAIRYAGNIPQCLPKVNTIASVDPSTGMVTFTKKDFGALFSPAQPPKNLPCTTSE